MTYKRRDETVHFSRVAPDFAVPKLAVVDKVKMIHRRDHLALDNNNNLK